MRATVMAFFVAVLVALSWATITGSLDRDVFTAAGEIWADPWGRATLIDAYAAFLTVWLWIAYREPTALRRGAWLVAILCLGNFAIATYALIALARLGPEDGVEALFQPIRPAETPR